MAEVPRLLALGAATTVGDAGFDDGPRLDAEHQLLHRHHVLRQLNDGATHPAEVVRVAILRNASGEDTRERVHVLTGTRQRGCTFSACGPFGPWVISNSTACPSSKDL